jgi:hypothetical protein
MTERMPFWTDSLDFDLIQVLPALPVRLGARAARTLWTVGETTMGRLNRPTLWAGRALLWTAAPALERDSEGWFEIAGCAGESAQVRLTLLEYLRDAWAHGYRARMLPDECVVPGAPAQIVDAILWHIRGWPGAPHDLSEPKHLAMLWAMRAAQTIERAAGESPVPAHRARGEAEA